jgi:hypothetical protein
VLVTAVPLAVVVDPEHPINIEHDAEPVDEAQEDVAERR